MTDKIKSSPLLVPFIAFTALILGATFGPALVAWKLTEPSGPTQTAAPAATCSDFAFRLADFKSVSCGHKLHHVELDHQHGWGICHCDAMAALREAWGDDVGLKLDEIERKLSNHDVRFNAAEVKLGEHGHQFDVVALSYGEMSQDMLKLKYPGHNTVLR